MTRRARPVAGVVPRWALAWTGGAVLGVANGIARDLLYRRRLGDRAAHQASTATLAALLAGYMWRLDRRWPLPSPAVALQTGAIWAVATVGFEFGLGRLTARKSWRDLLADYDVTKGRLWALIPAEMLAGPAIVHRLRRGRG